MTIRTIVKVSELLEVLGGYRAAGETVGLVPTMGALHAGHGSLARASVKGADRTVATIFVNPTQFAPDEDLNRYPRTLDDDVRLLQECGVDCVFVPADSELYPAGFSTMVRPPRIADELEGSFRPNHFAGVCTVVLKLLNIVRPDFVYFGQKDFQQVAVVRQMVVDFNLPVEIVVCPIVRDAQGLALSSRNRYLSEKERQTALSLSRTIKYVTEMILSGDTDGVRLMLEMNRRLKAGGVDRVDYGVICDPRTLQVQNEICRPAVVLVAAYVGSTRLIDNAVVD